MSEGTVESPSRRNFLTMAAGMIGAAPVMSSFERLAFPFSSARAAKNASSPTNSAIKYKCLEGDEAAFTEAMVNILCPSDHLTPDGVTCGLASVPVSVHDCSSPRVNTKSKPLPGEAVPLT